MATQLEEKLLSLAGRERWERGMALVRERAVLDVRCNSRSAELRIANDQGGFECLRLQFRRQRAAVQCTCSRAGRFCEHAVAGIIELTRRVPEMADSLVLGEPLEDSAFRGGANGAPKDGGDAHDEDNGTPHAAPAVTTTSLKTLVADGAPRAQLQLLVRGGRLPTMESQWNHVGLEARLRFDGKDYSAGNLKRLMDEGQAAGGMVLAHFPPQEQQIIRFLVGHGEIEGAVFSLSSHDLADLLHCLPGFTGLCVEDGQVHVHLERLEPVFLAGQSEDGRSVAPSLLLPGRGTIPGRKVSHIAGRGGNWIGLGCDYWWLPGILPPAWVRMFLRGEEEVLPEDEFKRLGDLCSQHAFPARLVSKGGSTGPELVVKAGQCRPVIELDWEAGAVVGRLEFDYGGKRVASSGPQVLWGRKSFVARDPEAEKRAERHLTGAGFRRCRGDDDVFRLTEARHIWRFIGEVLPRMTPQWAVYWSPGFQAKRTASGHANLTVRQVSEDDAWFELECVLKGPKGGLLSLDEVLKQLGKDSGDLVWGDSQGVFMLSREVQQALALLTRRSAQHEHGRFRLGRYTAPVVDEAVRQYWDGPQGRWQQACAALQQRQLALQCRLPERLVTQLRGYQAEGVGWLKTLEECGFHGILADEMGLGKTVQALAILVSRKLEGKAVGPALVVCPTSLLTNWFMEASRFAPELRATVVRGPDRKQQIESLGNYDLVITSYALLRRDVAAYAGLTLDYLILDEAQHIKNHLTANATTCKALRANHRLILTGTPMENSLSEVWSLFDFLLPGLLGSQKDFRNDYEIPVEGENGSRVSQALISQIHPFLLRRTKAEVCSQLPPKIEQAVYCELEEGQRRLYDSILIAGQRLLTQARQEGWQACRFQLLSVLMRLRQVCCHPRLLPSEMQVGGNGDVESAKTELTREIVHQAIDGGHRMLLFSQFTSLLKILAAWLDEEKIAYEYLDGSTKDRQERVDRFNRTPTTPVFLLSLRAGGTGLNLTGADTVIHYDQWWNPMVEDQATDRTHRIGQERPVTAMKLIVRDTIEEKVLALQASKKELFRELLAGVPRKLADLSLGDVEFLLSK